MRYVAWFEIAREMRPVGPFFSDVESVIRFISLNDPDGTIRSEIRTETGDVVDIFEYITEFDHVERRPQSAYPSAYQIREQRKKKIQAAPEPKTDWHQGF